MRFTSVIRRDVRNHVRDRSPWGNRPVADGPPLLGGRCVLPLLSISISEITYAIDLTGGKRQSANGPLLLGGPYVERGNLDNAAANARSRRGSGNPAARRSRRGKKPAVGAPLLLGGRYVERGNFGNAADGAFYPRYP